MSLLAATEVDGEATARRTSFRALGSQVSIVLEDASLLGRAAAMLKDDLEELDLACSRFRPDAEIARIARGVPVPVSPLLFAALETSLDVALMTGGAVDPTVGRALARLGYDRDFDEILPDSAELAMPAGQPAPGWWSITLDPSRLTASIPDDVLVDLGSSAKAFAADRGALRLAEGLGCGVLVNLGGDIAVAGPPPKQGWSIAIATDSRTTPADAACAISIAGGGLASSSTVVRRWRRAGRDVHHVVDPRTGEVASDRWALVSVAAPSCVEANAASTAAIVWGDEALDRLEGLGYPARLLGHDGEVEVLCGWPPDNAT